MDWEKWEEWADRTIPEPAKGIELQKARYSLRDIAKQCRATFHEKNHEVKEFAKAFTPDLSGLKTLFLFCDRFFEYSADTAFDENGEEVNMQALQSPAVLWKYRVGDCKSYSVFIQSCIHHMGLDGVMMLVDYGSPTEKHIYPNAFLKGARVPLDVVYKKQQGGSFATEKTPYKMLKKIKSPGLYTVGSAKTPPTRTTGDLDAYAARLGQQFPHLPNGPDITAMTEGEFDRWQLAERLRAFEKHEKDPALREVYRKGQTALDTASISGIGSLADTPFGTELARFIEATGRQTKPAFENPTFALPPIEGQSVEGFGKWIKKQTKKVKNTVKKVANTVAKAFKTLANAFHKGNAKAAAPFFLFAFLPAAALKTASKAVKKKRNDQMKMLDYMEKKGKFGSRQRILNSMATGIKSEYGAMPQEILKAASATKVGAIPVAVKAATAIAQNPKVAKKAGKVLLGVVGAIVRIFKKKSKEDREFERLAKDSYSDLSLLADTTMPETDYENTGISPKVLRKPIGHGRDRPGDGNSDAPTGGGSGSTVWIGLAIAAAAALALKK